MGEKMKKLMHVFIGLCFVQTLLGASPLKVDFSNDQVGKEPTGFLPVVGVWRVGVDGDNRVFAVDGSKWEEGHASAGLAEKAKALYGERYAEFLDSVKNYAYFPLAVAKDVQDFRGGEITVRFKPMSGRIDQGAGIVFNLKQNGDYLVVRANALENNLVLFKYVNGNRSSVKWIRGTKTETLKWHDLKVVIKDKHIHATLDEKFTLDDDWDEPISGRIGIWSKADSVVYFDDFQAVASGTH
jgi:hypothetical protein